MTERSDEELFAVFQRGERIVSGKIKKAEEDPSFEDAFFSTEGILNNAFYQEWEDFQELEIETDVVTLDYYLDEGAMKVSLAEYNSVYSEFYNSISAHLDPTGDEEIIMVDLEVQSIDHELQRIELKGMAYVAPSGPQWYTPAMAYYGAPNAGPCDGTPSTVLSDPDAATFVRGYANANAPRKSRCANKTVYFTPVSHMYSYSEAITNQSFPVFVSDPVTGQNTWQDVVDNYWKSDNMSCIGSNVDQNINNTQWYNQYNNIDYLINYGLTRAVTLNTNAEFHWTSYHAWDQQGASGSFDVTERYFHGGMFVFTVITCL